MDGVNPDTIAGDELKATAQSISYAET